MRRFVLNDRGRYKFWNVELQGSTITFSQGQVGRPAGRSETRSFDSDEQARAECEKQIKEKTDKGYVEKLPAVAELPPALSPALTGTAQS
jgi:predicted DNA-binding WGR domain protein